MDWRRRSIACRVGGLRGVGLRALRSTVVGGMAVPRHCEVGGRLVAPYLTTRSSRSEEDAGGETPAQHAQQDHSTGIEADLALPYDDELNQNFSTNELEDTFVSLVQAPPQFASPLRYQLVQQLLTTDLWLFIKEPAIAQEQQQDPPSENASRAILDTNDHEESFSVVELDLEHSKRPCIPAFTSESRAEEAMRASKSEKSFEAIGVQGLMLVQELNKESVPKDVLLNPFSRYGKRIAWEEVQWLAAHGRRLLKRAARPEVSDSSTPSTSKTIDVPEVVENPVRDPFKVFNLERK